SVGMGTYASRSLAVGGTALVKTMDKIVAKAKKIAAHLLEAAEADVEFADGKFSVAGTDRNVPFAQVAFAAYVPHNYPIDTLEPGLNETAFYDPINFTYPAGAYIAEVEIDRETGTVELVNFTGADDFGRIINPLIAEGQVHGALVQGIGQALYENAVYDESGQLETGSFMDYCMPRADNFLPVQARDQHDALHAQSAGRQRLRRGRNHRRARGDHERGGGCIGAAWHRRYRHARHLRAGVAPHGQLRQVPACSLAARFATEAPFRSKQNYRAVLPSLLTTNGMLIALRYR